MTFSSPNGFCADVAKIGTVNSQQIVDKSAAGKAASNKMQREGQKMEADLNKLSDEIKTLKQMVDQEENAGVMTKAAIEEKKWELSRKMEELKALKKRYDRKLQTMQMQLINQLRKDVAQIISDYGKKEGYLLIVENISVLYAPQSLDITDKIIQIYNKKYAEKNKNN
ncbi:MAG: OmpH family outer membrane protein [Desulfobacteraceae bacterium]